MKAYYVEITPVHSTEGELEAKVVDEDTYHNAAEIEIALNDAGREYVPVDETPGIHVNGLPDGELTIYQFTDGDYFGILVVPE